MHTVCSILNLLNKVELLLYVCLFLFVLRLNSFFKNVVAMQHGQPLQPRHKLIHHFTNFVPVRHASSVNLNIVLSEQALRLKIYVLDIETSLAELSLCIWSILGNSLVEIVLLRQALCSVDSLLNAVLNFAKHEHSVFSCVQLRRIHR